MVGSLGAHIEWLWGAQLVLTDVTLDDLWKLDLKKLHSWECVIENTAGAHPALIANRCL